MTDQLRVAADVQKILTDHLRDLMARRGVDCTVSQNVPAQWTTDSSPHIQVTDAAPSLTKGWGRVAPAMTTGPQQITGWAKDSTQAKHLANLCLGLLFVSKRPRHITAFTPGPGVVTSRDEKTGAELAFCIVTVTATTIPA